jgi:uncharacterized protein with von Willebrand factor type A (vWA) domain
MAQIETVDGITDRTVRLAHALQARGVGVSLSEIIDATRATAQIDLLVRDELRAALRATLVKDARHHELFDREFDLCFPARPVRERAAGGATADVVAAMATGEGLADAAAAMVDAHGGLDAEIRSEKHHIQRVFLGADIARLMSRVRIADPTITPEQLRARLDELKRLITADVRAQLDIDADPGIAIDVQDVDFLEASRAELDQMRAAIRPIARKLAARLARRRQHRTGRANIRRTIRRSLGSGGVPIDVAHDRPRAHKPELFVLCDISGSVADFSLFTLTLMSALSAEITRTRSFVFVDAIDEVTELLGTTGHAIEPWQLMRNTRAIGADGHSDYGAVFEQFWAQTAARDVGRTATVLITGDARTNHRPPGDDALARISERARRVYWLNPEPADQWNTHDSAMSTYAAHCHGTHEVRTLHQLVACVEQIV